MAQLLPGLHTTVLSVPVYRKFAQPYVALPNAVLDASMTDPGSAPPYRIRPGNVIVLNSGLGRFVSTTDPTGDRCQPATIIALEKGTAAWNGLALTFSLNGGPPIAANLGAQTATEAQAVTDLMGNPVFAASLVADATTGSLRIRTLRADGEQYLTANAPTRPTLFGASGAQAQGSDADYRVTEDFADLLDILSGQPTPAPVTSSNVGAYVTNALINLTPEARVVLTRKGAQFF